MMHHQFRQISRDAGAIAIRLIVITVMFVGISSSISCRKKADSAAAPAPTDATTTPDIATAVQSPGVSQITNLAAFPKLDNGGKILAAIHCDPKQFQSAGGAQVLWLLNSPHPPDSALWILALDPASGSWVSTGEVAIVSSTGGEAIGPVYRTADFAISDLPLSIPQQPTLITEWVWLFSVYDRKLDGLARALTEANRASLHIPPGVYLTVGQWLGTDTTLDLATLSPEINGSATTLPPLVVENTAALTSARAKFAVKKAVIDQAFIQSFERWSAQASKPGANGAAAIWQAVIDLRLMRGDKYRFGTPAAQRFVFCKELGSEIEARLSKAIASVANTQCDERFLPVLSDYLSRSSVDIKLAKDLGKTTERTRAWLITSINRVLAGPDTEGNFDRAMEPLAVWADALIDQSAWTGQRGPVSGAADFRKLGTLADSGYLTGFATKWDYENVLEARFGEKQTTAKIPGSRLERPPDCSIKLAEMRKLLAGETIEIKVKEDKIFTSYSIKGRWIANFAEYRRQLDEMEKELKRSGDAGEKAWLALVAGEDKARAAAALRILMYDLRSFLTRNTVLTPELREKAAIENLTVALQHEAPKTAQPYLRPFAATLRFYSKEYIDYFSQSHIHQPLDVLDNTSMRAALSLLPHPAIAPVYVNRDVDLDNALQL